jgi:hypothetical protein
MSHGPHTKIADAGLADGCPRCAEMAERPLDTLDDDNLRALIDRTVAWMRDQEFPRSDAELRAMRVIEQGVIFARVARRLGVTL